MRPTRSLTLRKEVLAELPAEQLAAVNGAQEYSGDALTCPLLRCLGYTGQSICVCTQGCG